ncbi:hypothetical protein A3K86_22070 [Photobacterium jeanii]|uniref:DUF2861 domain-containing protein n=2 Tax=Photobacterium jeanii TaxID=858640 RepID=A0A178K333_9GAMM|nr:hypothetical protein A3K86_22070 [Photobacterium jeanii]PST91275.1 DUF2861 domain-containing protein [Photobacterium jeanii]
MVPSASAEWFLGQDLYTLSHQRVLEGKTSEGFDTMIQAWQQAPDEQQNTNLDGLLKLALTEDCGRSLTQAVLPSWLSTLSIRREVVQNLNQVMLKLSVSGASQKKIDEVTFTRWPDQKYISTSPVLEKNGDFTAESSRLEKPIAEGLYKITLTNNEKEAWSSWVILGAPSIKQRIGWKDSKNWRIEHSQLPNPTCPSPVLSINLYDLNDLSWTPIWTEEIDGKLPTTLPQIDVPDGRYWLSVGLIESRWQGDISILDIQRITRPIDFQLSLDQKQQQPEEQK